MRRFRRHIPEARLELVPLIDVMMSLLTFTLLSMALMVRVDLLDVRTPALASGRPAQAGASITVSIDAQGRLFVNRDPVEASELADRIRALRVRSPAARIYIAADEAGRSGDLLAVVDRLVSAGLSDFSLVGKPIKHGAQPGDTAPRTEPDAPR